MDDNEDGAAGDAKAVRVALCLDVASVYSWFCLVILLRYKDPWRLKLSIMPVLLGAVHNMTGNVMPTRVPARGRYLMRDLARNAQFMGVPYKGTPLSFGSGSFNSMNCQRLLTAVALDKGYDSECLSQLCLSFFESIWGVREKHDVDITSKTFLLSCCIKAGFTRKASEGYMQMSSEEKAKACLKENTTLAVRCGAYGTPSIFVQTGQDEISNSGEKIGEKDAMFFGSDRFEQLAFFLGKPWNGPHPTRSTSRL